MEKTFHYIRLGSYTPSFLQGKQCSFIPWSEITFHYVHPILFYRLCSFIHFFTQKWASLYSSFWIRFSSPQASGKETTLLSLPTLSTYQPIMLHNNISVINDTPVVTRRPFPLWLVRKNLCKLLAVMYLTSAPQQQLDDFCNGALTELLFHILLRNSQSVVHF